MSKLIQTKVEEEFHDGWAHGTKVEEVMVNESFEAPTAVENQFILRNMGDLRGKKILDFGCGLGEASVYFAKKGADVTALDISQKMLDLTKNLAKKHGLKIKTVKVDGFKIPLADNQFDIVYGFSVLHHVDIVPVMKEVKRVLKKDGVAYFTEPLLYNPLIILYRRMSKELHTPDEHPFRIRDIKAIKKIFPSTRHKEFWFFSLFIFVWFFITGSNPNKVRYWKKIIKDGSKYKRMFRFLYGIDRVVLKIIPPFRYLCWNIVLVLKKQQK